MNYDNQARRLRREVMIRMLKVLWREGDSGELEALDRIPLEMVPRSEGSYRCCIYRDRAVLRYRLMAALGYRLEEEEDELKPLAGYARERSPLEEGPVLTVLEEACSSCTPSGYSVTNLCRGCVARPCQVNCPKDAVTFAEGKARIDPEKCVNCGKCQRVCPYGAIVRTAVPCEEACPVGAIRQDERGRAALDGEKCIACGKCLTACPFGAVMERSQAAEAVDLLGDARRGARPAASVVAPSAAGQFPGSWEQLRAALGKLGFSAAVEAAAGAERTVKKEAAEWLERGVEGDEPFMLTSCCSSHQELLRRHLPELQPAMSETPSPMVEVARGIKESRPEAAVVFIGPCTGKRLEGLAAEGPGGGRAVDCVLTFEELGALLVAADWDVRELPPLEAGALSPWEAEITQDWTAGPRGRGFPLGGGVHGAVAEAVREETGRDLEGDTVDGLDRGKIKKLKALAGAGRLQGLIEVMACEGGCVGGAGCLCSPRWAEKSVKAVQNAGKEKSPAQAG